MTEETKPGFNVNGKHYPIPEDLTLGEMCDAERFFGVEFGNQATSGLRMVAAMLWIAITRVDPTVTVDDIRALPPETLASLEGNDALPPASGEEESALSATSGTALSNGADGQVVDPSRIGAVS